MKTRGILSFLHVIKNSVTILLDFLLLLLFMSIIYITEYSIKALESFKHFQPVLSRLTSCLVWTFTM